MLKRVLFVVLFFLAGCQQAAATTPTVVPTATVVRAQTPSEKGYELFSYKDADGMWVFALLESTGQVKTLQEIEANPLLLNQLKQEFKKLAEGETVLWLTDCLNDETDEWVVFPIPPEILMSDVLQASLEAKINLRILIYN